MEVDTKGVAVYGVGEFLDRLHMTREKAGTIEIYKASPPYGKLGEVRVDGLKDPWDMTVCRTSRCIYVTDLGSRRVWRVDADGGDVILWMEDLVARTMSVTSTGRVLILSHRLDVYRSDGRRAATITLPADMDVPQHAIETPTGTFVVSHGWMGGRLHRVCEVTADGRALRVFGGAPRFGPEQMNGVYHMATDAGRGWYFVADSYNHRVLLLDAKLQLLRVLLTKDEEGLNRPQRLSYSSVSGRLMVATTTGKMHVFLVHVNE